MKSMKAVRVNEWGKAVQVEDIPQPIPGDDEILVRIHAASINPFDIAVAAGYLSFMLTAPRTLGADYAGEVIEIGKDVVNVKKGDAVYGMIAMRDGTFAEYATPKVNEFAHKPKSLDYIQTSAIPLAATAAWQTLFDVAQLKSGERLLIQGVAGSVGSYALQFAKEAGAYVYGTDIPERAGILKNLGLDRYINHKEERVEDIAKDVDVVLDLVGSPAITEQSYNCLKRGGRYITTLVMQTPQEEAERLGIQSFGFAAQSKAELLTKFAELVDSGKLKVLVNRTFPLEQAQEAMDFRGKTPIPGKVVFDILA